MVKAQELTIEGIMGALRTGAFYSTLGPEIMDLVLDERELTVKCSAAQSIVFKAECSRGKRILPADGELLTEATYSVPKGVKYIRVEITDETGKKAWSNPFFF